MKSNVKIGVVGLWHLGCVLSAAWSKLGFDVTGFDYSKELISDLGSGRPPVYEPDLEKVMGQCIKDGRLRFTNEIGLLKDRDYVFLAYDTPVLDNDDSDLSILYKAINDLGGVLKDDAIVIVSSQTPSGTCNKFRTILQQKKSGLELVCSPENLRLGEAIECYLKPGRIILGADTDGAMKKASDLFRIIQSEIISMNIVSAEMVKHAINSYLATSITFANHLADLCDVSGANIFDVVSGAKSDPRIGSKAYLSAGIGFSGGTLGRDLKVLENLNNLSNKRADIFESIYKFNFERKFSILGKIRDLSNGDLASKKVGVLGVTYKPGTSTLRRSMPLEIIRLMLQEGADVSVYDPKANYDECPKDVRFEIAGSVGEVMSASKLVVLFTEWPEFRSVEWSGYLNNKAPQTIFDTKNYLAGLDLPRIGYNYFGVGYK